MSFLLSVLFNNLLYQFPKFPFFEKIEIIKKSILKTVSQLNEINSIKLLIENEKI